LGACDRDLASCKDAYMEVTTALSVVAVCRQHSMLYNPATGKCATEADVASVTPAPQAATTVAAPITPAFAGTVKFDNTIRKAMDLDPRAGFALIGLALLWFAERARGRLVNANDELVFGPREAIGSIRTQLMDALLQRDRNAQAYFVQQREVVRVLRALSEANDEISQLERVLAAEREAARVTTAEHQRHLENIRIERNAAEAQVVERGRAIDGLAEQLRLAREQVAALTTVASSAADLRALREEASRLIVNLDCKDPLTHGDDGERLAAQIELLVKVARNARDLATIHGVHLAAMERAGNTLVRQVRRIIEENLGPLEALARGSRSRNMKEPALYALRNIRAFAANLQDPVFSDTAPAPTPVATA
ncbi:MAG TPA: hypothetical protein VJB16_01215, partial [archaeon]|nr:hypothetical protein [archaeon]